MWEESGFGRSVQGRSANNGGTIRVKVRRMGGKQKALTKTLSVNRSKLFVSILSLASRAAPYFAKMPSLEMPSLTLDEIDDLLYFTRVNEVEDLQQTISELSEKYNCSQRDVIPAGVDPESGNTLLHYCSANGFADLLKALLLELRVPTTANGEAGGAHPASSLVNTANKQGNTALHWASLNGQLDVVKILVDAGADLLIRNSAGHLAVFEAERAGKEEVVEYLLEKGGLGLGPEDLADVPNDDPNASNGTHQTNGDENGEHG